VSAVAALCVLGGILAGAAWAARLSIPTAARLAHRLEAKQRHDRGVRDQTLGPARRRSATRVTFAYSDLNAAGNYRCRSTIVVRISGARYVASFSGTHCASVQPS
jgi:hypothetical protein